MNVRVSAARMRPHRLKGVRAWNPEGPLCGGFPFAAWLDREELIALGRHVVWSRVGAGEFLWRQGDDDDRLALVVKGRVKLLRASATGRTVVLGLFAPGALVADLSFAGDRPRETSAFAAEDLRVVLLSRKRFDRLAAESPGLAGRILAEVLESTADQLRCAYRRLG